MSSSEQHESPVDSAAAMMGCLLLWLAGMVGCCGGLLLGRILGH